MFSNKRGGKKVFQNENEKSFSSSKNEGILWTMSSHSWSKTFCKYFTMEIPKRFQIVNKSISGEGKQDVQSGEE